MADPIPLVDGWQQNGRLLMDAVYPDEITSINLYALDAIPQPAPLSPGGDSGQTVTWHSAQLSAPIPGSSYGLVVVLAEVATEESGLTPASDEYRLQSFDADSGDLLHDVRVKPPLASGDHPVGSLVYTDGREAVYEVTGQLTGFSLSTGHLLWQSPASSYVVPSSTAVDGILFSFDNPASRLVALNPDTGKRLYAVPDAVWNHNHSAGPSITAVSPTAVLMGTEADGYAVMDLRSGQAVSGLPAHFDRGFVDGRAQLLSIQQGKKISTYKIGSWALVHSFAPAIYPLLMGASDGNIYARTQHQYLVIDASSGTVVQNSWSVYPVVSTPLWLIVDAGVPTSNPNGSDLDELIETTQPLTEVADRIPAPTAYP